MRKQYGRSIYRAVLVLVVCLAAAANVQAQEGTSSKSKKADESGASAGTESWLAKVIELGLEQARRGNQEARREGWISKVIEVQHADVNELARAFQFLEGSIRPSSEFKILTVHAPPDVVQLMEETVRKLDVPHRTTGSAGRDVELVVHFLGGTETPGEGGPLPPALQKVVRELERQFPYRSYRLLETAFLRARGTGGREWPDVRGVIAGLEPRVGEPVTYRLRARISGISRKGDTRVVHLKGFSFEGRIPIVTSAEGAERTQFSFHEVRIGTEVDVLEGKTVVVGKTGVQGSVRGLFLVLTANVVE